MAISTTFAKARLFLRTLQRAPEPVRRKWQYSISALAFIAVVAGWVFYLNISLVPSATPAETTTRGESIFETFRKGFDVVGSSLSEEWVKFRELSGSLLDSLDARVSNPSVFTFVREEPTFVPVPYEPVPSHTLPVSE